MKKISKEIFVEETKLQTQTTYMTDGRIFTHLCSFEYGHDLLADGCMVTQKGRMVTFKDGTSRFRPYASSGVSRYQRLFATRYAEVKESGSMVIVTVRLPKALDTRTMTSLLKAQANEVAAQLKNTRKNNERRDDTCR